MPRRVLIDPDEIVEHERTDQPRRFASACPNLATDDDDGQAGLSHLMHSPDQLHAFVHRIREAVSRMLGGVDEDDDHQNVGGTCPSAPNEETEWVYTE